MKVCMHEADGKITLETVATEGADPADYPTICVEDANGERTFSVSWAVLTPTAAGVSVLMTLADGQARAFVGARAARVIRQ